MDDMPLAVGEILLSDLECPVCTEYMVPPIKLCTNGHNTCSKCRERVQRCPTCRAEFSEIRCLGLEKIVRKQNYPCANRQGGCLELFSVEHITEHHDICEYRKFDCPFQINIHCSSKCTKSDMKNHLERAHIGSLEETSTLRSDLFQDMSVMVLFCFGELFVHHQRKRDGRFYWAVQLIGTNREASYYKCEFTLCAANGFEKISNTFSVQGYSEDWETNFSSGKCFCLDEVTVKHFLVHNKLNLTITVSTRYDIESKILKALRKMH
jgi:E3 ubiquitin-protein ligase SIAH1